MARTETLLDIEIGYVPAGLTNTTLIRRMDALYAQTQDTLTPSKLRTLLDGFGFTMTEGKSKHHFEQEGKTPFGDPYLVNLVMDKGYTDHEILNGDRCIGHIFLRRNEE
jgi:hypothetical protein